MVKLAFAALAILLCATEAQAAGFDAPEWTTRLGIVSRSNLFPGYVRTGADQGLEGLATIATETRLGKALKLGLEAKAAGEFFTRFTEARQGSLGATVTARRGGTQLVAETEWTPRRVKFPAEPEDAVFRRIEGRIGARQALPAGLRARLEARFESDRYERTFDESFDARDARSAGGHVQLGWRPGEVLAIRLEGETTRSRADDAKHSHRDHLAGAGIHWRPAGRWSLEGAARSGVKRYTEAEPTDSNYRRRDQWLEATITLRHSLLPMLDLTAGGTLLDQTSSRSDRTYTVNTLRLGLEWTGGGKR